MTGLRALKAVWLGARLTAPLSRRLAGRFAWHLWFTPWRVGLSDRAEAREAAWLDGTTSFVVPFGRRHLQGFSAGDGPVVLLVHGWGDRASRLGAFIAPLVDAGFRVVGVDFPGHGASAGRRTNAYEMADAVRATADEVGGITGVVAHSMGGVATTMALGAGLEADRVVLLGSAVRLEHAADKFQQLFALPDRVMAGLRDRIEVRFGPDVWSDLATDVIAARLQSPALLFHDRSDAQVDFADGQQLAGAWPGARLVATDGLGHDRLLRDAEVVAQAVQFLTGTHDDEGKPEQLRRVKAQ